MDETFPEVQFYLNGYSSFYHLDRNASGGATVLHITEDIRCKSKK